MKRLFFLFFLFSALSAGAQIITYDTIRVSSNDERNIHRNNRSNANIKATSEPLRRENVHATRNQPATFDKSKLRFGANLGLSISSNYTNLGFGPQIGYQFNDYFMAGTGVKYYYTRARTNEYEIRNNLLGANLFGYFYPVNFITLFAQPELNYIWAKFTSKTTKDSIMDRGLVPSLVVGAGFRLGRSHVTLNYDLVQHTNSPHPEGIYLGVSAFF
ncbi:putative secreted protein [Proteiniphilum saccharofermentans]|uniref:Putative secreted protein n=1 Tax=Proteiniphilum saccharofermentans TaxID=1642647 RepID=A0A1R3T3U5_9BACT|nr:outer membrane beta-barrel protein [Proteiniphilum saccharofermentans]SCD19187.1 putative secreted protein [Proteiniphilum saccharofermentans]